MYIRSNISIQLHTTLTYITNFLIDGDNEENMVVSMSLTKHPGILWRRIWSNHIGTMTVCCIKLQG